MSKQDAYPAKSTLVDADYVTGVDSAGPFTIRMLLSAFKTYIWTLANIPAGATSPITRDNDTGFAFVASGGVWSGDAYASTKNASMTAMVCYINGRRISIAAVTARTFTASKDTYIDILDNTDGTGTIVYTEVTNNAASPALAANSLRIGIIITGASNIANSGSINQGQETILLPITSSTPYAVTDSLGNLICCRDPQHQTIGYRIAIANQTGITTTPADLTSLSVPVNVPTGRKITIEGNYQILAATTQDAGYMQIMESSTVLQTAAVALNQNNLQTSCRGDLTTTPSAGSHTYKLQASVQNITGGNGTVVASSAAPAYIRVRLV